MLGSIDERRSNSLWNDRLTETFRLNEPLVRFARTFSVRLHTCRVQNVEITTSAIKKL